MAETKNITPIDLAYMAGIIDGEGSITITVSRQLGVGYKTRRHRLLVQVSNTDKRLMDWLAQTFDGSVTISRETERGRQGMHWTARHSEGKQLLEALIPYLKLKKQQAEIGLRFLDGWERSPTSRGVQPNQLKHRDDCAHDIQSLNKPRGSASLKKGAAFSPP